MSRTVRPIAVIGMACRYPGAPDPRALWENILARRRQFRTIPDCRLPLADYHDPDPNAEDLTYGRRAAVIDGWSFDPAANRVPRSSFEATDVVHWLTLDIARQAVQNAGLDLERLDRDRIGMVLGNTLTGEETRANSMRLRWPFLRRALKHAAEAAGLDEEDEAQLAEALKVTWRSVFPKINEDSLAGGLANTIAGRVCNVLDLHGGGYVVDGACASSLLALATAAEMLENEQLDIALAGGVDVSLDPFELVGFAKATALSSGDMNVYDRRGKGFMPGEGCGVVVLQRLEDARRDGRQVLAVLRGWGISSDGRGGITAPSARGQALALRRAYERAGYSPHTLDFVEGHGTGTAVGDRVELAGIAQALEAFGAPDGRSVGVTSFKSIVGHTKAAAGIGGFIKAVLAVNQRVMPPTAGCLEPHGAFGEEARALYPVLRAEVRSPDQRLRAGVSAMGFGGINAHVTLESGDPPSPELATDIRIASSPWGCEVFPLSAASRETLRDAIGRLRADAAGISEAELADLAVHVARRPVGGRWRACVVAATVDDLRDELSALLERLTATAEGTERGPGWAHVTTAPRLGFLFPGQGSQLVGMAAALVDRYPWARERIDQADRAVSDLPAFAVAPLSSCFLRPFWHDPAGEVREAWLETLTDTRLAQPAIALASALWLEHLERLGLRPRVVGGHSLGELTALHASGAFDLPTLVRVAALRGQAMAAPAGLPGAMAALICDAETALSLAEGTAAVVANRNAPDQTVVSGPVADIETVLRRAKARALKTRRLQVSNAFHSPLVGAAAASLEHDPRVPVAAVPGPGGRVLPEALSCTDGRPIGPDIDLRLHIAAQIVAPVDFMALTGAIASRCDLLIEVGPGRVLSGLVERCGAPVRCLPVESVVGRDREACAVMAEAFVQGIDLDWSTLYEGRFVRPFVPARERLFYRNPCERPFPEVKLNAAVRLPRALRLRTDRGATTQLEGFLSLLRSVLSATHAAIFAVHAHGRVTLAAQPPLPRTIAPTDAGLLARVLERGEPWMTTLLVAESGYRPELDGWPATVLHGALALPMTMETGHALVLVARTGTDRFEEADLHTLSALAASARALIGFGYLEQRDEQAHRLEEQLSAWAKDIEREQPVRSLIRRWLEDAVNTYKTEAGSLFLHAEARGELYSVAAWRRNEGGGLQDLELRFPVGHGIAGHVFSTGEAVQIEDAYADDRFNPEIDKAIGFRTLTIDCLPLKDEQARVIGVLQLLNRRNRAWGSHELEQLRRLADQLAPLIGLLRLVEGVHDAAELTVTAPAPAASPAGDARQTLYRLVSERTGFALESLRGGQRLLDDLNLDSIKAGALLAELGGALSMPAGFGQGLANATLDDIVSRAGATALPGDVEHRLYTRIEARTGFAVKTLHRGLRLLDDLNLDSIKAGALLAEVAREAGLAAAPEGLANATLGEILERFAGASAPRAEVLPPPWVADFVVRWDAEPIPAAEAPSSLVVVGGGSLAEALAAAVPGTQVVRDGQLAGAFRASTSGTGSPARLEAAVDVVILMPEGPADLEADVRRLANLTDLHDRVDESRLRSLTLIQRGDGQFGQDGGSSPHLGLRSFAASVAQDRPGLRVLALDLHADLASDRAVAGLVSEIALAGSGAAGSGAAGSGAAGSGAAGIRADGVRCVPTLRRIDGADGLGRVAPVPAGGVALVTGGAKGITAECALALARVTGCRLVLVGSSAAGKEVAGTLERMSEAGIQAEYRRCDVADGPAVEALVASVRAEVGPIRVVLHGAGLNRPRPVFAVPAEQAMTEISPKLRGAEHLLHALADQPPALFVALTSVIGVLGMAGNAWYAFSNERLDLALRQLARRAPGTRVVSFAYSVWDEVGMGVKLGSVAHLARRGIGAIPVEAGVAHFRRWLEQVPPDSQVVITSRMGSLAEGGASASGRSSERPSGASSGRSSGTSSGRSPGRSSGRFRGTPRQHTPGVEFVTRVQLHVETDRYLRDHDYRGSLLFPTVMGLEAMGQAVLASLELDRFGDLSIQDIGLERPIVVHPTRGEEIEVRAVVRDREKAGEPMSVEASIHTAASGFGPAHFKARFVLKSFGLEEATPRPEGALDIQPVPDLYGGLLFQGPVFQRIQQVLALDAREVTFITGFRAETLETPEGFSSEAQGVLVAGDPFHRDTLLQAAQVVVSPDVALPTHIGRIDLRDPARRASGPAVARARFLGREGDTLFAEVHAWDVEGSLVERITGYHLRVLERDERLPDVPGMLEPQRRDEAEIQRRLDEAASRWQLVAPRVALLHRRGLHALPRTARREVTEPLLLEAARRAGAPGSLRWEASGRPVLTEAVLTDTVLTDAVLTEAGLTEAGHTGAMHTEAMHTEAGLTDGRGFGLSLSHDDTSALAVAGSGPQGCDLLGYVQHTAETWRSMLARNVALLESRVAHEGLDRAGQLLWAAQEAGMKALGSEAVSLSLAGSTRDGTWHLRARAGKEEVDVISLFVRLARGGDRAVAAVVRAARAPEADFAPAVAPAPAAGPVPAVDPALAATPALAANPALAAAPAPAAPNRARGSAAASASATSSPAIAPAPEGIPPGYGDLAAAGARLTADGPEGQWRFTQRSMVVFKEASEPSGGLRHSHLFRRMGELRELAARPVLEQWEADFLSGRWGAVTNHTWLEIEGVARAGDEIEGSVWSAGLSGPLDSTMELRFSWQVVDRDGARRPLARGSMATTWVEITGHGEAIPAANPPYLQAFAERIGPPGGRRAVEQTGIDLRDRGALVHRPARRPGQTPLFRAGFNTSREHSNIVGNIYFAHYPTWQGEAIDEMLARMYPPYARGRTGELRIRQVRLEHFREAMPYDQIEVQLHLDAVWERGLSLRAEIFRRRESGLQKLAAGELEGTWYAPASEGTWTTSPLPAELASRVSAAPLEGSLTS